VTMMMKEDTEPLDTHGTCPDCGHKGCLVTWETNTYCHSCGESKPMIRSSYSKEVEFMTEYTGPELNEITKKIRSINKDVCEAYGVTVSMDTSGEDVRHVYPYPHKEKYRYLPKDFSKNKGFTSDHLFGMDKFNAGSSKVLTICEGELDVLSVYQMLGKKWPVVGLPSAGISKSLLMNCEEYIKSFESIAVCTDNDQAGDKAADKIASAFPSSKVYRVQMTKYKDPNEFLEAGDDKDFLFAWINKKKYVPEYDTSTVDGYLEIFNEGQDAEYITTGIEEFDQKALGLVQGVLTVFQAPEGTGKTELFRYFEHHMIKNYPDTPFAMCHLEESKQRSLLGLVSYDKGKNLTRKQLVDPSDNVEDSIKTLTGSENVHLFSIGTDEDPMVLVERIKYYTNICECKYVFFEPIQDIAHQRSPSDGTTEQFLTKMSVQLARVASETGCGIVVIAHENDDGLVRDCRMIPKQASVVVQLTRDMDNKDPDVANITTLTIKKNRPASLTGYAGQVKFDPESFTLEEFT